MRKNPKWKPETGTATYPFSIPGPEVKRDSKILNQTGTSNEPDLAAEQGMKFALQSLRDRWLRKSS